MDSLCEYSLDMVVVADNLSPQEEWNVLQVRRRCLERLSEMRLQTSTAALMEAEAKHYEWKITDEMDEMMKNLFNAKADHARWQAEMARERATQGEMELRCLLKGF